MKRTIEEMLHVTPYIKTKAGKNGLPLYLTAGVTFYDVKIYESMFSVVKLNSTENTDIHKLKHGLVQYEKAFVGNVAYCIPDITSKKRDALIKARIPFIAPPAQIYLPFLGIVLQDRFPKERLTAKEISLCPDLRMRILIRL